MDAAHEKAIESRAFIDALRECLGLDSLSSLEADQRAATRKRRAHEQRGAGGTDRVRTDGGREADRPMASARRIKHGRAAGDVPEQAIRKVA